MAYQSLYRKWRPQTFAAMVGQEVVSRTLENAVRTGRIAHAYLFTGPRGTGKTSAARLFAKALNCAERQGAEPCDRCSSCVAIREGHSVDVLEIDGASNRGIGEIRELREHVGIAPMLGRYRFYIIDEVHQLTDQAFNALLKTLEEPPAHVIFILATTDAHKVPATIASRCQQFSFQRIAPRPLRERLSFVAQQEGIEVDERALALIVQAADGSLRDALSLLDQAVSFSGYTISAAMLEQMLGFVPEEAVEAFVEALRQRSLNDTLTILARVSDAGGDLRQFTQQVIEVLRRKLLTISKGIADREADWSGLQLVEAIRILAAVDFGTRFAVSPELALELAVAEICFGCSPLPELPRQTAVTTEVSLAPTSGETVSADQPQVQRLSGEQHEGPMAEVVSQPTVGIAAPVVGGRGATVDSGVYDSVRRQWETVVDHLRAVDKRAQALCNSCVFLGIDENVLLLSANGNEFVHRAVNDAKSHGVIERVVREVFGRGLVVRCDLQGGSLANQEHAAERIGDTSRADRVVLQQEDGTALSGSRLADHEPAEAEDKLDQLVRHDPTVKMAMEVFGAKIDRVLIEEGERLRKG